LKRFTQAVDLNGHKGCCMNYQIMRTGYFAN
jgi:hypothetical protein